MSSPSGKTLNFPRIAIIIRIVIMFKWSSEALSFKGEKKEKKQKKTEEVQNENQITKEINYFYGTILVFIKHITKI